MVVETLVSFDLPQRPQMPQIPTAMMSKPASAELEFFLAIN
jgi:hypothetical protein